MQSLSKNKKWASWFLRIALAAGFLSAVADRFGLWGPPGSANVAWGSWVPFLDYVATLNWFAPASLIPVLGWIATITEVVVAVGLLAGWELHWFSTAAGVLLLLFALTMTFASGLKSPLDASVFAASAGAFVLAAMVCEDETSASSYKNPGRKISQNNV